MLRKFLATFTKDRHLTLAWSILRVSVALLMIPHGFDKMSNFMAIEPKFMNFAGLGTSFSLSLTIFAELFCSVFLLFGLLTRFALIPLIITMLIAAFYVHSGDIFGDGQTSFLFAVIYVTLFIAGPGTWSADDYLFGRRIRF